LHFAACHAFHCLASVHGSSLVFLSIASVPTAKAKNPTAAVFGSPAGRCGLRLTLFDLPPLRSGY